MFSRKFVRVVATMVVTALVSGCAEFDRRGGIVDYFEDAIFFRADTKTHRLLRSYLLATVLLTASRREGHNDVDRTAIAGALEGALAVANEAYMCLYPGLLQPKTADAKPPYDPADLQPRSNIGGADEITDWRPDGSLLNAYEPAEKPRWCQFFDEKMARLDYALYKLATVTLFNVESRQTLNDIQTKLIGHIPVVSDTVAAAIHANKAVNQATTIIDDLLNLAFNSAGPVLALLPLYRDSLELDMWVIVDNQALLCRRQAPALFEAYRTNSKMSDNSPVDCQTLADAVYVLQKGNGHPRVWREFLKAMNDRLDRDPDKALAVEAYRTHFFLLSQLLMRSCRSVLSDAQKPKRCEQVLVDALEKAAFDADNATGLLINNNGDPTSPKRWLTTSLPLPGAKFVMTATRRTLPGDTRRAPPGDVRATGSIPAQPKPAAHAPQLTTPPAAGSVTPTPTH